ncbi:MAG: MFS transporter [Aggregatilineales bacterium]
MIAYSRLLRNNPGFARLWLAQVVSLTGDWFTTIVLSTIIADFSDGSGIAISLFLLARFVPPLIFGPFAGVLVDRYDRRKILMYSNVIRVFVVLGFLLATSPDRLWIIYVLTVLQFSLSALFEPGQSAITPSIVHRDDLVKANTLASITWSTMLAVGALIGGLISALFGPVVAIVVDAITFAVAAFILSTIHERHQITNPPQADGSDIAEADEDGSFLEGLRYLRKRPATLAVTLVKGAGSIGNVDLLMTVFATQIFILGNNGSLSLGIMYSAFGIGAFLGPLLLNRFHDGSIFKMRRVIAVGFVLAILGWVLLGSAQTLLIAAVALAVRAMGGSANWTYSAVILQKSVPDRYLGRVFSLDIAFFQLITVLSTLVHGFAVDVMTAQKTYQAFEQVALVGNVADSLALIVPGNPAVRVISYVTAVVAILPLLGWMWVLATMQKRQDARVAAEAA